jgi:rhodanese-related sulfurtransferase
MELIVYCSNKECALAQNLAEKLSLIGYEKVFYMPEGWEEWNKRALPMGTTD